MVPRGVARGTIVVNMGISIKERKTLKMKSPVIFVVSQVTLGGSRFDVSCVCFCNRLSL